MSWQTLWRCVTTTLNTPHIDFFSAHWRLQVVDNFFVCFLCFLGSGFRPISHTDSSLHTYTAEDHTDHPNIFSTTTSVWNMKMKKLFQFGLDGGKIWLTFSNFVENVSLSLTSVHAKGHPTEFYYSVYLPCILISTHYPAAQMLWLTFYVCTHQYSNNIYSSILWSNSRTNYFQTVNQNERHV